MFKFIKKLFIPKRQYKTIKSVKPKVTPIDYSTLTKGDLKRLVSKGTIKSIYFPYK